MSEDAAPSTPTGDVTPPAGDSSAAPSTSWTDGLNETSKGFVSSKGYQSLDDAFASHMNLEKLLGGPRERLVKLPEDSSDAAAMGEVYNKLGRPETADKYSFEDSSETLKWARNTFHEIGLSDAQANALITKFDEYNKNNDTAGKAQWSETLRQQSEELKTEWGAAYDQNVRMARNATKALGLGEEKIEALESALGFSETMKLMHSIGSKVGESDFIQGSGAPGVLTPEQAQYRLRELESDPAWVARYTSNDQATVAEARRLDRMAYPFNTQ